MKNTKPYNLFLEKTYRSKPDTIFVLFRNLTFFKLTGADHIQSDFRTEGLFCLTFNGRGSIHGRFVKITDDGLILEWNVEGFQRPDEKKTFLEITLHNDNDYCVMKLRHNNIMNEESLAAKLQAWKEILNEIDVLLLKNRKNGVNVSSE